MNIAPEPDFDPLALDGVEYAVASIQRQAELQARAILRHAKAVVDGKGVRALAMVLTAAAAEKTAGGNVARPAFRAYTDSAMTVLENDCSEFVRGPRR